MNVCYACGREVSWAWGYVCPVHGRDVMVCTQERWNELQELRRLLRIEEVAKDALEELREIHDAWNESRKRHCEGEVICTTTQIINALATALEEE